MAILPVNRRRIAVGVLAATAALEFAGLGAVAIPASAVPVKTASAGPAAAKVADPPESSSTAIALIVNGVPAAGIGAFAGTYGVAFTGPAGGLSGGATFTDPDGVLRYVTAATHTSQTNGTPSVPTWFGRADLVHVNGPSLVAGGPPLVNIPELHNFAQCTPPHALMTDSHVTPQVLALGHVLTNDGPPVTASASGAQLGLPGVQSASLTFTMRTTLSRVGVTSAAIRSVITIGGVLTGHAGTELYSGPLATLTLADVTADCTVAPTKADVQIVKSGPAMVLPGGTVTYTLEVINHGPGPADDVTVQDPVSEHLTDIRDLTSGCSVIGTTAKVVECSLGTMADGAVRRITFTGTAAPGVPAGTAIGNCGTVYTTTPETDEANNQSCLVTTVEPPPPPVTTDVSVVKSGPAMVLPGGTVSYTVTVTNHSATDATDVVLGDAPGALGTLTGAPSGCTLAGGRLTCLVGTLAAGASRTFTVTVAVAAGATAGETLTNCAAADTSTPESDEDNNQACATTTIEAPPPPPPADIAVAKSGPATALPGGTVSYTVTVTNASANDAHDVVLTDVLGPIGTLTGAPAGCTLAGDRLTCVVGTLAAGASRTFTVTATVAAGATPGDALDNCAAAQTSTPETSEANNHACAETTIESPPPPPPTDIAVAKSGPATALPGGTVAYTVTVSNPSAVDAHDVVLTDVLGPIGTLTGAPAGCTLSGGALTCAVGTLAAGASRTFTVTATVAADAPPGEALDNCATAETSSPETSEANNQSCVATTIESPPPPARTDIAVAKFGPSVTTLGGSVTYRLTVTNNSDADAHDVVINDVLGEFVGLVSAPRICALHDRVLTCSIGLLAAGESRTIAFTATPAADAAPGDSLQNCEDAQTTTPETTLGNNTSCAATIIEATAEPPQADIGIAKAGPAVVKEDGSVSYSLTVTNHSAFDATQVVVTDALPDELGEVTAVPAGCSVASRILTCDIGTMTPLQARTFTVTAMVARDLEEETVIENCGVVYADPASAASCVSTTVENRVIPVGPPATGGGFPLASQSGTLVAAGWALLAGGIILGALGLRARRRPAAGGERCRMSP